MNFDQNNNRAIREELAALLQGGFAPVVILLREFHYDKTAVVLEGLPFSAWSLLEHMRQRQDQLLRFMKSPEEVQELWPAAYWPENPVPEDEAAWHNAINRFEKDLEEMIGIVKDPDSPLFEKQQNGKSLCWVAVATLQHNAYHIGQIKAIGRQLGVW